MAVFQGTRIRTGLLPTGARPIAERRARRSASRAERRVRPIGIVLAVIMTVFLLGLVYLTQTLQSALTTYQTNGLQLEAQTLEQELRSQRSDVARWGSEPQVIQWAQQQGLDRLGGKLRIPSR